MTFATPKYSVGKGYLGTMYLSTRTAYNPISTPDHEDLDTSVLPKAPNPSAKFAGALT